MFRQFYKCFTQICRLDIIKLKNLIPKAPPFLLRSNIFGFFTVHALEHQYKGDLYINFEEEMKRATLQGEKYLAQLMRVLRTLILQTSLEYQECLITQIELIKENTKIGPIGEHWDRLTHFRVQGNELKDELDKYEALAGSIGQIVSTSLDMGNKIVLNYLNLELDKLQKLCNEQLLEVHKYESELLAANRDSILHGIR